MRIKNGEGEAHFSCYTVLHYLNAFHTLILVPNKIWFLIKRKHVICTSAKCCTSLDPDIYRTPIVCRIQRLPDWGRKQKIQLMLSGNPLSRWGERCILQIGGEI